MSASIVVGHDPESHNQAPLEFAETLGELTGARVVVVTAARGFSVPRRLHEAAEGENAGLIVCGCGSIAERLAHGAPCPVATVPDGWRRSAFATVGVAWQETDEANEALRGAHALAGALGAKLRVLTVSEPGLRKYEETEPRYAGRPEIIEAVEVEGDYKVRAEEAARRAVAALGGDVEVEVDAFLGDPADVLLSLAANLDLLVCGSRGYGPLRAVLLGSVSRRLAREARRPVIIVPRGIRSSLDALLGSAPAAAGR